jgi:transposase
MGAAYSQDLRDKVLAACDRQMKTKWVAEVFSVSPAWVRRVKQRRRECGETSPRKTGSPGVRKIDRERLAELVREQPDATIRELRERLGIQCSDAGVGAALKAMDLSFKKRQFTLRNRTVRTSPSAVPTGARRKATSTPTDLFSSTRRGPRPT